MNFFKKIFSSEKKETLDKGLEKSKTSFFSKLSKAVAGKSQVKVLQSKCRSNDSQEAVLFQ